MSQLVSLFLMSRRADGVTPKTLEWHKSSLLSFTRWLERNGHSLDAATWDTHLLREYVVSLQESELSPHSVRTKVQSLLAFTRWLHAEGFTDTNIGERIKKPKAPHSPKQPFTNDELKRLLTAAQPSPKYYAILSLLIDCGVRADEVCSLRMDDLLLEQNGLIVHGKGMKDRYVPYSVHTGKALLRYITRHRESESPYLFPTERSDRYSPRSLLQLVVRIGRSAGVSNCNVHRFRHTFAVAMLRNRADPLTLQRLLGHTTLTMTNHYVSMNTNDLSERHAAASPLAHLLRGK